MHGSLNLWNFIRMWVGHTWMVSSYFAKLKYCVKYSCRILMNKIVCCKCNFRRLSPSVCQFCGSRGNLTSFFLFTMTHFIFFFFFFFFVSGPDEFEGIARRTGRATLIATSRGEENASMLLRIVARKSFAPRNNNGARGT